MAPQRPGACHVAFDLLRLAGQDLRALPLEERRRRLAELVDATGGAVATVPHTDDRTAACAWLGSGLSGIEGVVAKRRTEPYRSGARRWVKVRRRHTVDVVVGGLRGTRLLLGLFDERGRLHHVGETVGLAADTLSDLVSDLAAVSRGGAFTGRPPGVGRFDGERYDEWVEVPPVIVVEVSYTALLDGRFRHAVRLVRRRPDREPESCSADQLLRGVAAV